MFNKLFSFLFSIGLLLNSFVFADENCFLAKEKDQTLAQEGNCQERHAPCSTFKIVISLMAYNEGLLIDEMHPELAFKKGYVDYMENWKQPHTPTLWMKNSTVWFSQVLTKTIGINKFNDYIKKFNYGNQDTSGDLGKNNGLTNSWLSSSLKISPIEQMEFLQNLLANKLPVSSKSQQMTRNILYVQDLPNGWKLYGKTGSSGLFNHGWFVGWVKKENRQITFVNFIQDESKQETYAGPRAKEAAIKKLLQILQDVK